MPASGLGIFVSERRITVAEKISKTARASLGQKGVAGGGRACPQCGTAMVATKVIRAAGQPGGMYWVCQKDEFRIKTR
jgi:hypothetical protein